jgi:hypothetical protein
MRTLEPQTHNQLKTFNQTVVLPAFEQIREELEPLGYRVRTTEDRTREDEAFDEMLSGLMEESSSSFLTDSDALESIWHEPRYIVSALMVQLSEGILSPHSYKDRFCLGVQCDVSSEQTISAAVLVFHAKRNGALECFQDIDSNEPTQPLAMLTGDHILQRFIDGFEVFRALALEEPEPVPESMLKPVPKPEPDPVAETMAIAVPDISLPPPPEPFAKQSALDPFKKAQPSAEIETDQRSVVSKFLQSLDVKRSLWPDEARGRELVRLVDWLHVVQNMPIKSFTHRQAQDLLNQQAAQFAKLLKPQSAIVFTDYFDLYCSAVRRLCASLTDAGTDAVQVFIEQVEALRDPNAPSRANPKKLEEVSFLFRSLARQFGKPDEFMLREWIGESPIGLRIDESMEPESVVSRIQARSKERLVRFNRLSWAVLQVFQNDEILLTEEPSPGRNGVERFLHSAALTIREPTEEVRCVRHQADEVEFIFERILLNKGRQRMAQARVIAFGTHGWVFLHSYGFGGD